MCLSYAKPMLSTFLNVMLTHSVSSKTHSCPTQSRIVITYSLIFLPTSNIFTMVFTVLLLFLLQYIWVEYYVLQDIISLVLCFSFIEFFLVILREAKYVLKIRKWLVTFSYMATRWKPTQDWKDVCFGAGRLSWESLAHSLQALIWGEGASRLFSVNREGSPYAS